jgi:hypothetical protein
MSSCRYGRYVVMVVMSLCRYVVMSLCRYAVPLQLQTVSLILYLIII